MALYESPPMIARTDWDRQLRQFSKGRYHRHLPPRSVQGPVWQCTADALTTSMEYQASIQGRDVLLSAADLYDRVAEPGGGSNIGNCLREAIRRGVGLASTSGTVWRPGMTPASEEERALNRVLKVYESHSFEGGFSSVIHGYSVVATLPWYPSYKPDKEGWVSKGVGTPWAHAVFGYKPAFRRTPSGGIEYGIWFMNSLGTFSPSTRGCCVISEELLKSSSYYSIAMVS